MGSVKLSDLTPDTQAKAEELLSTLKASGLRPVVVSTRRTCADQFANNKVGNPALGCRSWHLWGRAVDIFFRDAAGKMLPQSTMEYSELGRVAKSLGFAWGGDFQPPAHGAAERHHVQYSAGLRIADLCPDPKDCVAAVASNPSPMPNVPPPEPPPPAPVPTTPSPDDEGVEVYSSSSRTAMAATLAALTLVFGVVLIAKSKRGT